MARAHSSANSQPPSVELTVRQGPRPGQRFSLTRPTITIGREAGNDVLINHPQVSRRHASLTWDGRRFVIRDLGSINGTFVNGVRLTAPHALQPGDLIGLGPTVLLTFQTPTPAYAPPPPPMSPTHPEPPRPPARSRSRILILLAALLGLCCLLAVAAAAGYYFLRPGRETRPLVLIRSPRHGEQVEIGQEVIVHSIARDEGKVVRVELWVDGQLQESQAGTLPGGTSPFPLLARWQPSSPGTHTLIARAFNAQGGRGQASVNVEAVEPADRDGDRVADEADACPDEPGPPTANGCPDRDGDGLPDAEDACPDVSGLPANDGCPFVDARDRDGDGLLDETDACPDEPGSPLAAGCPDADGDGVADAEDACPDEPGLPEDDGCPVPEDRDGDGVLDADDACPDEPGLPEHAGCPDRDGDGIRDRDDACPDEPGPGPGGCPDTGAGDRDGDGIPDDADLCPDEPGPGPSGCPPPGGGEDADGDGIPDDEEPPEGPLDFLLPLPPLGPYYLVTFAEFQALEFEVYDDYDEVHCYARLAGGDVERYDFEPLGERRWDIAAVLGGENSRTVAVPADEPSLEIQVECWATNVYPVGEEPPGGIPEGGAWGTVWNLGSFIQNHPRSDRDGHVIEAVSTGGTDGHHFRAQYRLCADSCAEAAFAPPLLSPPVEDVAGNVSLVWHWEGDRESLEEYRVYLQCDGASGPTVRTRARSIRISDFFEPHCDERCEFYVTAYGHGRESPPSNTVVWEGRPCLRRVRVTWQVLRTFNLPEDRDPLGSGVCSLWSCTPGHREWVGPVWGVFWANGEGHRWEVDDGSFVIGPFFSIMRWMRSPFIGDHREVNPTEAFDGHGVPGPAYVPVIELELGPHDDLTIGGWIDDVNYSPGVPHETLFEGQLTLEPHEIGPRAVTITDSRRDIELVVVIGVWGD